MNAGVVFESQHPDAGSAAALEVRLDVKEEEDLLGALRLVWRDGRAAIDRDEELALEVVADAVAERVGQLVALEAAEPQRIIALRR
jgi:UDP-GlcNAc:undecaprenyl-phosphate GlcNAc-1-phosphate transferase